MNFLVLAAGKGSRFENNNLNKPKSLIKIKGTSLIENIIDCAVKLNINKINVVTGYKSQKIKKIISKKYKNIKFINNKNYNKTEMLYSLIKGLNKISDDVIISYSDIYYDSRLIKKIIKNVDKKNIYLPVLNNWQKIWIARKKNIFSDGESLKISNSHFLKEIGKKIKKVIPKYQYMGIIYIPKNKIKEFISLFYSSKKFKSFHVTSFLNYIIKNGVKIKCLPYTGRWFEFDDMQDLKNFNDY